MGCIGYDRKGVPNPLKAAVLEHGRSNQPAKPWAKPAGRKAKKECIKKMQEALDSGGGEIMSAEQPNHKGIRTYETESDSFGASG